MAGPPNTLGSGRAVNANPATDTSSAMTSTGARVDASVDPGPSCGADDEPAAPAGVAQGVVINGSSELCLVCRQPAASTLRNLRAVGTPTCRGVADDSPRLPWAVQRSFSCTSFFKAPIMRPQVGGGWLALSWAGPPVPPCSASGASTSSGGAPPLFLPLPLLHHALNRRTCRRAGFGQLDSISASRVPK